MTYEELSKVNSEMQTVDIKGKPYPEVNEKIKAFRKLYPEGSIETFLLKDEDGRCLYRAVVANYDQQLDRTIVLGTGHAFEVQNSSYINKTSYIENCETSAVGRALSMAGFGIDKTVASLEEVAHAMSQQSEIKQKEKNAEKLPKNMADIAEKAFTKAQKEWIFNHYKVKSLTELTSEQYGEAARKFALEDGE